MTYKEWFTRTTARFDIESADVELILANQQNTIPNPEEAVEEVNVRFAPNLGLSYHLPTSAKGGIP